MRFAKGMTTFPTAQVSQIERWCKNAPYDEWEFISYCVWVTMMNACQLEPDLALELELEDLYSSMHEHWHNIGGSLWVKPIGPAR